MNRQILIILFLFVSSVQQNVFSQSITVNNNPFYKEGILALQKNEIDSAEVYFNKSIKEYSDAPSYYQLAKINEEKNTVYRREIARNYIEQAILKEPENIEYKFLMAKLAEKISSGLAAHYYEDIIKIDSTNSKALYNLGRIEESEFDDYNNSVTKQEDNINFNLQKFADKDFKKAENFLLKAIKYDSLNRDAYMHLGFLYEDEGKPKKGIPYLKHVIQKYPEDANAYLYLGLLYYESSSIKESYHEYQTALILMPDSERQDFVFNSVKELLEPVLGKEFKNSSDYKIKKILKGFWTYSDPLYLTEYNERLLEHYSRVAYANLRYSLKNPYKPGWKTDRGEMILRYGWPNKKVRYRPQMEGTDGVISMKTDVWYYDYFVLGFTDQFMNNNFVFSEPDAGKWYASQFSGETDMFVNYLRKALYTNYKPKFEGPLFSIPFKIVQFKNFEKGNYDFTDVYVNYAMDTRDSSGQNIDLPYEWGLFFFDLMLNPVHHEKGTIAKTDSENILNLPDNKQLYVDSKMMTLWPDSGVFAFEVIRKKDKGVSTNHCMFRVKKYFNQKLSISDLVLAYKVKENSSNSTPIKRGDISVYPNPTNTFTPDVPLYIYYEIYNLKKDKHGLVNFQQRLILKRKEKHNEFANAVNSVMNLFGLGRDEQKIIITTNYQVEDRNPKIYFQLDMNKYPPGDYELTIEITEKATGNTVKSKSDLIWK